MEIFLGRDMKRFVRKKTASGKCTASEVIDEALHLLEEREQFYQFRLRRLRKEIDRGLESVKRHGWIEFDAERIKAEGRRRLAAEIKREKRNQSR
jgi:putative addiction module CopG family antidote